MRIRQRRNGEWCMEHNGVEAPYDVEVDIDGAFTVFDSGDEDRSRPIARRMDAIAAEALALAHFKTTPFYRAQP